MDGSTRQISPRMAVAATGDYFWRGGAIPFPPGLILQDVLAQFTHLRVFALEPDSPERRNRAPPRQPPIRSVYPEIKITRGGNCPHDAVAASHTDDVVAVPGEPVRLLSRSRPDVLYPEIYAIQEVEPPRAVEDESESEYEGE
ncbi:hypothetical protein B0H11DRAFT_1907323 [Mycena galericulata]|nr:hypothetical protein B0H11DRAFT_1907323 [Mycena galericulata]